MNVPERIQALRKRKGISQEELANELGVSRQAVSKWESGQSFPELDNIVALCDFFGVSTDYILKGTEPACSVAPQTAAGQTAAAPKPKRSVTDLMKLYIERKNAESESEEKEVLFQLAMTQKQKSVLAMALFVCSAVISVMGSFILGAGFSSHTSGWVSSLGIMLIGFALFHIGKRISAKEAPFTVKYINRASFVFAIVYLTAIHTAFSYMDYQYWYRTDFAVIYILAAAAIYGLTLLYKRIKKLQAEMYPDSDSLQ